MGFKVDSCKTKSKTAYRSELFELVIECIVTTRSSDYR